MLQVDGARGSARRPGSAPPRPAPRRPRRRRPRSPPQRGPKTAAAGPCHRSASRGPPATTTMNTPCMRPRISSVATVCSIDDRYTELTRSPAPATARHSTASHSGRVRPKQRHRRPPDADRGRHRDALAPDAVQPAGEQARDHHPERDRREEQAQREAAARAGRRRSVPPSRGTPRAACRTPWPRRRRGTTRAAPCAAPRSRKPSTTSRSPARRRRPSAGAGGTDGSRQVAHSVASSATASSRYSVDRPTTGMSTPANIGPATAPAWTTVMFSAFAAGRCSAGSSRGRIALRVGWFTARNADCTANSTAPPTRSPPPWPRRPTGPGRRRRCRSR